MTCKKNNHNYLPTKLGNWIMGWKVVLTCTKCGDYK